MKENVPGNVPSPKAAERVLIDRAKREHKQTTESAQRALKVAVATTEVAQATLGELHRQGQQLDVATEGVTQIEEEVKEASALVRFMRRFCCLAVVTSCCSDCACVDPDAGRVATRKQHMSNMQRQREEAASSAAARTAAKQSQIEGLLIKAHAGGPGPDDAGRGELFGEAGTIRAQRARQREEERIGYGLPAGDRAELRAETRVQEECLDRIGAAVDALNLMSQAMHEELVEQDPKLDRLAGRVEAAHDNLRNVQRDTAVLVGRRVRVASAEGGIGNLEPQAAAAATAARYSAAKAMA